MRRESSTVVVLVGEVSPALLTDLAQRPNVSVVRPPESATDAVDAVDAGARALREAGRRMSPFVLVAADPLASVAKTWHDMWDVTAGDQGAAEFELRVAEALAAWRAGRFELPDYYLVLSQALPGGKAEPGDRNGAGVPQVPPADAYLGPIRAARPHRVAVAWITGEASGQAIRVVDTLRSLQHGPWWPSLDQMIGSLRHFYAGSLHHSSL